VDRGRVGAERDVVEEDPAVDAADVDPPLGRVEGVERRHRVVRVEAEVTGEVVARPERDDDEGQVALERDGGHRRERAVAAGHADDVRAIRVELCQVADLDVALLGRARDLGKRACVAGARVDEEDAHRRCTFPAWTSW
jgi:hypothetical protein